MTEVAVPNHIWTTDLRWTWQFCKVCGIVKRADGKNKPCKGPTKVGERG